VNVPFPTGDVIGFDDSTAVSRAAPESRAPNDLEDSARFPQHPDVHCPQGRVLLAIEQQPGEGAATATTLVSPAVWARLNITVTWLW
jgi:hypothetical protein